MVSWADSNLIYRMGCNGLHGEGVAAPQHGRAYAGVCAFLR